MQLECKNFNQVKDIYSMANWNKINYRYLYYNIIYIIDYYFDNFIILLINN